MKYRVLRYFNCIRCVTGFDFVSDCMSLGLGLCCMHLNRNAGDMCLVCLMAEEEYMRSLIH